MDRDPDADAPRELPPPPAARTTDRWALDPGAIVPGRPGPTVEGPPPTAPRRRRRRVLAIALGTVVAVAAAGGAAAFLVLRGSTAALLERVPADVDAVAVVYLDPSAGQKVNLARITDAFPGIGGAGGAEERLEEWGDEVLTDVGLRYDDVTAWLGVEVAAAVDVVDGTPQVAVIADVADRDGAERMLAKLRAPGSPWEDAVWTERQYEGVTLSVAEGDEAEVPSYAFDEDALIMTSDPSLLERVIDAQRGTRESIATASSFVDAEAELPEGRLMIGFFDMASFADELQDALGADMDEVAAEDLADLEALRGVAMSLSAEPDGVALDVVASYDPGKLSGALREQVMAPDHENELLGSVPADAWGVFGAQHLDLGIRDGIEQLEDEDPSFAADLREAGLTGSGGLLDVLSGDLALFAAPDDTTTVGGAVLLGVIDESASRDAVERVAETAAGMMFEGASAGDPTSSAWSTETHDDGTTIHWLPDVPVAYAIRDRTLIVGTSVEQVEGVLDAASEGALVDDPTYQSGMEGVPATDVSFFVDVGRVLASIREALPAEERDAFNEDVGQDLRAIRSVAFGVDMDEARQRFRLFVAIPSADDVTA